MGMGEKYSSFVRTAVLLSRPASRPWIVLGPHRWHPWYVCDACLTGPDDEPFRAVGVHPVPCFVLSHSLWCQPSVSERAATIRVASSDP